MAAENAEDITRLLAAWSDGDEEALTHLIAVVYPEIRRIGRRYLSRCAPCETFESAALANEAYLKLIRARGIRCENRLQFFALCAQIIRRFLVDHARERRYAKRGGEAVRVELNESIHGVPLESYEVIRLDDALETLARFDERKAKVVELRFFGGLSVAETAEVLKISEQSVLRDWRLARSWLAREMEAPASSE